MTQPGRSVTIKWKLFASILLYILLTCSMSRLSDTGKPPLRILNERSQRITGVFSSFFLLKMTRNTFLGVMSFLAFAESLFRHFRFQSRSFAKTMSMGKHSRIVSVWSFHWPNGNASESDASHNANKSLSTRPWYFPRTDVCEHYVSLLSIEEGLKNRPDELHCSFSLCFSDKFLRTSRFTEVSHMCRFVFAFLMRPF